MQQKEIETLQSHCPYCGKVIAEFQHDQQGHMITVFDNREQHRASFCPEKHWWRVIDKYTNEL